MNEDRDELEDIDILVSQGIIREIGYNIAVDTKTKIIDLRVSDQIIMTNNNE